MFDHVIKSSDETACCLSRPGERRCWSGRPASAAPIRRRPPIPATVLVFALGVVLLGALRGSSLLEEVAALAEL